MKFLKISGWVFFPFIILPMQWKNLGKVGKGLGSAWAVVVLLSAIGNAAAGPKQPTVVSQEKTSNASEDKSASSSTDGKSTQVQTSSTSKTSTPTTTSASTTTATATNAQPVAVAPATKQQPVQQPATQPVQQPKPQPKAQPKPVQQAQPKPAAKPANVYYATCKDAKAAGAAPLREGDPGYRAKLDRDKDGIACE